MWVVDGLLSWFVVSLDGLIWKKLCEAIKFLLEGADSFSMMVGVWLELFRNRAEVPVAVAFLVAF